jgi:hypothetical protein
MGQCLTGRRKVPRVPKVPKVPRVPRVPGVLKVPGVPKVHGVKNIEFVYKKIDSYFNFKYSKL